MFVSCSKTLTWISSYSPILNDYLITIVLIIFLHWITYLKKSPNLPSILTLPHSLRRHLDFYQSSILNNEHRSWQLVDRWHFHEAINPPVFQKRLSAYRSLLHFFHLKSLLAPGVSSFLEDILLPRFLENMSAWRTVRWCHRQGLFLLPWLGLDVAHLPWNSCWNLALWDVLRGGWFSDSGSSRGD